MDKEINFTQRELQVLYSACMSYGNGLRDIIKKIVDCDKAVDLLNDVAKESWNLAMKITGYMEDYKS